MSESILLRPYFILNLPAERKVDLVKPSFEDVALRELSLLYRVAKRLARNETDAEDLVGSALLSAAKAWDRFDGRYARSWLVRILRNEHLSVLRARGVRPQTVAIEGLDFVDEGSEQLVDMRLDAAAILRDLDTLPEDFRIAVTLCDVEEMPYEEIAAALEIPVGTVKSRLNRGRRMLRDRLCGKEGF